MIWVQKGTWWTPLLISIAQWWCWRTIWQICNGIWWWWRCLVARINARITTMDLITEWWISPFIFIALSSSVHTVSEAEYKTLTVWWSPRWVLNRFCNINMLNIKRILLRILGILWILTWLGHTCSNGNEQAGLL